MDVYKGFVLQSTYRTEGNSPIVLLYGRLENGSSFLVRESRQTPAFFVKTEDSYALSRYDVVSYPTDWTSVDGFPVTQVETRLPNEIPPIRNELHAKKIVTYEADVRFAVNYLIERNIQGGCEIHGNPETTDSNVDLLFTNPEVRPCDVEFSPILLSFDIETDPQAKQLLAISLYADRLDEVYIVDPDQREMPDGAIGFDSEKEVIDQFVQRIQEFDPDVLTGWNVIDFDLNVLNRVARRVRTHLQLGRDTRAPNIRKAQGYFGSGQATIGGRLVLDGMDLVRGAYIRFDEYTLDAVAHKVLGEGKAMEGDLSDRADEILRQHAEDLPAFAKYARTDSRLAYQIVEKLKLLPLAVARSKLTGMTMDRVSASIASFDFVYMSALRPLKLCAPSVRSSDSRVHERHFGGHVLEPEVGIHENVWVFDYKSLYPSVMRTFNIDPVGFVNGTTETGLIKLLNGAQFRRGEAILSSILDTLFEERELAKKRGDSIASQAVKILMNSFYGVLATPACRFHESTIANSITTMGRHFLLWSKSWFEGRGYRVLYGDTDSVFVLSGHIETETARRRVREIIEQFNTDLGAYIKDEWKVESKLMLEYEKLYQRLFLLPLKRGTGGARKRYAGLLDDENRLEFVGLEAVRRDWTDLAKVVQRELYERLFTGQPVEDYLYQTAVALRAGKLNDKLVYRKGLSKPLNQYKNAAPHVVAAKKSKQVGRVVHYMITTHGPEPLDCLFHAPDHAHYLNTQVRSVAEPVLEILGLDFDFVVRNTNQIPLF